MILKNWRKSGNKENITINGFEIKNFQIGIRTYGGPCNYGNLTIQNCKIYNNTQNGILIVYDIFDTVTIENCQINNNTQNGIGIANSASITNLNINNSVVSDNTWHGMFLANTTITNLLIKDSAFDDTKTKGYCGITFGTTKSNIGSFTMEGGSLSYNKGGGFNIVQAPSTFGSITLDGVTIQNNNESGVMLGGGASTGSLSVRDSTFQGNWWEDFDLSGGWWGAFNVTGKTTINGNDFASGAWAGVYIGSGGTFQGGVEINFNNFIKGGKYGIYNLNPVNVDATCNWWGDPSGPSGEGPGTGDAVSTNVDYDPWSTISTFVSVDAGPDQTIYLGYGSKSVTLTATAVSCGDVDYLWSTGDETQSITVYPTIPKTTYSVEVTDSGLNTATDSVTVNVIDVRCGNKYDKVSVCHKGKDTLCISADAVPAHLGHGDYLGACK